MSYWTHIRGTINVEPFGRSQPEKRYILDSVLEHLPIVSGSEGCMSTYVVLPNGHNSSCSCDEFGDRTNNLVDMYGEKSRRHGWHRVQSEYIIVVNADLRDRLFHETMAEFTKWLVRLSKRVLVNDICVNIRDDMSEHIYTFVDSNPFYSMYEEPSWSITNKENEPAWWEYLAWEKGKDTMYPMKLIYKYYCDSETDAEMERRMIYMRGEDDDE